MMKKDFRKYIAEYIGTFALVFCGTGAVIVDQETSGSLGLLGISIVFGLIITAMIYIFGSISGTHINPAVTIALGLDKKLPPKDVLFYIIFQISGAITASILLRIMFPKNEGLGGTIPAGETEVAFIIEAVLTFFLMLTILGITSKKQKETNALAGIVIGFIVIAIILIAGPISGGSFNPARSIGPALISTNTSALWVYIVAPILGAIIAMLTWKFVNGGTTKK